MPQVKGRLECALLPKAVRAFKSLQRTVSFDRSTLDPPNNNLRRSMPQSHPFPEPSYGAAYWRWAGLRSCVPALVAWSGMFVAWELLYEKPHQAKLGESLTGQTLCFR